MLIRSSLQRAATLIVALVLLTLPLAAQSSATQSSAAPSPLTLFGGRIVDEATERPIVGATVEFPELDLRLRSDSTGAFYFGVVKAGEHPIAVRAVGYLSLEADLTLAADDSLVVQFQLSASAPTTLAAVSAEANRPTGLPAMYDARLKQFEESRAEGVGRFIDWTVFEDQKGRDISRILRQRIPGLRIVNLPPGRSNGLATASEYLATRRSNGRLGATTGNPVCYVQVIVDMVTQTAGFDLTLLRALDVIGFEYYNVSQTPSRYTASGDSSCGTAVFWTKR